MTFGRTVRLFLATGDHGKILRVAPDRFHARQGGNLF